MSVEIPPVMKDPMLLPSGQAWEQTCTMDFIATDAQGDVILRHPCGLRTQGGTAGLSAHQQLVHTPVENRGQTGSV